MAEERDADNQTHLTLMSVLLLFWCHILFEIDIFLKITNNSTITKSDEFMERKKLFLIDDRLYSAILRSLEQTHCACMRFCMSD